jgi:hypothetical protein
MRPACKGMCRILATWTASKNRSGGRMASSISFSPMRALQTMLILVRTARSQHTVYMTENKGAGRSWHSSIVCFWGLLGPSEGNRADHCPVYAPIFGRGQARSLTKIQIASKL